MSQNDTQYVRKMYKYILNKKISFSCKHLTFKTIVPPSLKKIDATYEGPHSFVYIVEKPGKTREILILR